MSMDRHVPPPPTLPVKQRRNEVRYPAAFRAILRSARAKDSLITFDVSYRGLYVASDRLLAPFALVQLGSELALAQTDAVQLALDRAREWLGSCATVLRQAFRELRRALLRFGERRGRSLQRIGAVLQRRQLRPGIGGPREELRVRLAAEPSLRVGDSLQLGLHLFEPVRLGLKRVEEPAQLALF